MAQRHKCVTVNITNWLWVRFPLEEMKYLFQIIFLLKTRARTHRQTDKKIKIIVLCYITLIKVPKDIFS